MSDVNIRAERINRGLTIKQAADAMGLRDFKALARAESGSRPHPLNALKIASFYGYQVTDVWPLDREPAA